MVVRLHVFYCPTPLHNTMNQSLGMKEPILYNKYGICITSSILRKGPSEYPTRDISLIEEYRFNKNTLSKYLEITEETIDGVVMGLSLIHILTMGMVGRFLMISQKIVFGSAE